MKFSTFIYKLTARNGLKGNWQTPMLLTFISGLLFTACSVLGSVKIPNFYYYMNASGAVDLSRYVGDVLQVPKWVWITFYACLLLGFIVAPMLNISLRAYLLKRLQNQDEGLVKGLTMRVSVWGKALWLYVRIYVQTFLWSLLLIVPGILAAIRYSMAPFYLAAHPEMTVSECMQASKIMMKHRKGEYALLFVSFMLWSVALNYLQVILSSVGLPSVLIMVLAQFAELTLNVYMITSFAAYYTMNSTVVGLEKALEGIRRQMESSDIPPENREQMEMFINAFMQSMNSKDKPLVYKWKDGQPQDDAASEEDELPFKVPTEEKKNLDSKDDEHLQ